MAYLFGDSSESSLEHNYLSFLRDVVDLGVELLLVDTGMGTADELRAARAQAAEDVVRSIEDLGRATLQVTEPLVGDDVALARCAASIAQAVTDAVKREVGRVRAGLATELQQLDAELTRHRGRAAAALTTLLATHDLPDADETITVAWGTNAAFEARLRQRTELGLDATVALEIPPESLFAHDLRVEKIVDGLEVHVPEAAGWMKKVVKMVPHKAGKHHVTEVTTGEAGVTVRLRATHEPSAAGLDVTVAANGGVTVARVGGGADTDAGFATDERDVAGLRSLTGKLDDALRALRPQRGALIEASFDGKPLSTVVDLRVLVERLVAAIAPVVREIAKHSLSPHELVLRRLLGGNRREEIFLSRAELVAKLEPLPEAARQVFAPLGLVDAPAPVPAPRPPPEPTVVIAPEPPPPPPPVETAPEAPPEPPPPPPPPLAVEVDAADVIAAIPEPPSRDSGPSIEMEADLPPVREASPMQKALPSILAPRRAHPTLPPPPPRPPAPADVDDDELTEVVRTPPRPPTGGTA